MNAAITIAKHLKVNHWQVIRVEEWAKVFFVVVKGLGARFVSKKVTKMIDLFQVPALSGSEKQVAWAEKIRSQKLKHIGDRLKSAQENSVDTEKRLADWKEKFYAEVCFPEIEQPWLAENVFNQVSAEFWINNRDTNWLEEASMANRQIIRQKRSEFKKLYSVDANGLMGCQK